MLALQMAVTESKMLKKTKNGIALVHLPVVGIVPTAGKTTVDETDFERYRRMSTLAQVLIIIV